MRLRSWLRRSVLACVASSLLMAKAPAVALVDPADVPQWQTWMKDAGWSVIAGEPGNSPDQRVQSLAAAVEKAIKDGTADPARIYLVGRGPQAAYVYYTISRVPDLWA